jgi:radical SAM superfamily enzyme YgiQ (UPF0313 family)
MEILQILAHKQRQNHVFHQFIYKYYYPSLTLEQLAAITPKNHLISLVDERWETIDTNWDGDLVAISCLTHNAFHAYTLADTFRKKGKIVVLGGYHPSALPHEAKQHADSVVIGEAERSWPRLLKDIEHHRLKSFYQAEPIPSEQIPAPQRRSPKSFSIAPIQASRGCPYHCKFCTIHTVEGEKLRMRPIQNVIQEIQSLPSKHLFFADSTLTSNPTYTKNLFNQMKPLNKTFSCYGNINILGNDEKLLQAAQEAGCNLWLIGFESINQQTINNTGKHTNVVKEYASTIKKIHDHGMMIMGLFIFGFDTDYLPVFQDTYEAIQRWELDRAGFAILTPFPGTQLFKEFNTAGRILTKNWSQYNLKNVVFQPKHMSTSELSTGVARLVHEFYSVPNILRRILYDGHPTVLRFINRIVGDYLTKKTYNILGF